MSRVLLEGGIVFLFVLIGVSIFIPSNNNVSDVIVEFEGTIESGDIVEDGTIEDVEVSIEDSSNLISRLNAKVANSIVNGLNSILEIGMKFLRKVIN